MRVTPPRRLAPLPIESNQPVLVFAVVRFALTLLATIAVLVLHVPDRGHMIAVLAGGALPWTLLVLVIATVEPETALNPAVALGDFALLVLLQTGALVGRLRTTESASRLRARSLSRRTIQAETEVRRKVAEAIHDGPVQDLIGLDMILSAAHQAAGAGDAARAGELVDQARELAT